MNPDLLARLLGGHGEWPLAERDWERLLSQARRANLAARLGHKAAFTASMPTRARQQLDDAQKVQQGLARLMRVEVMRVAAALDRAGICCVLLKGAAYLLAELPPAGKRIFGDIDVLVPPGLLDRAESALLGGGWLCTELGGYNRRYYREWMHEVPPLRHVARGSVVDLHHTIVPPTSRFRVDGAALLAATRIVDPGLGIRVLQPVDMVLHSAVHLFTDGEFEHGLRDLIDLDDLLRHFESHETGFWPALFARADELGLERPLFHALFHIERLFGQRVPADQRPKFEAIRPPWLPRRGMAWLLTVALRPDDTERRTIGEGAARWLLYVRSHWLRMPLRLLLPHLVRKAWMRRFPARPPLEQEAGRP